MTASTDKLKKTGRPLAAAAFWLIVWQLAAMAVGQELILPSPVSVLKTLGELCAQGDFWLSALFSLGRILAGLLCGIMTGTLFAVLIVRFSVADALLSPAIRIVRATPVASFIILALLWIGRSRVPGFIAALMVIPVVSGAVETAIRQTDGLLLEMGRAYGFKAGKMLRLIYIPSVLPAWSASCVTAMGLAWKAGIAAEVLCQPKRAIGSELYYSKIYIETPELFAWTAVVIILSFIIELVFKRLLKGRVRL
ncbi:MAG: ABC transporter permease [Oscillospiraceae bacterium]